MGFNVTVLRAINSEYEDSGVFINRSYYNFVASYDLFGEKSVIISVGNYLGLDLHPLVKLTYLDNLEGESQEEEIIKQNVDELLTLVKTFAEKVQSQPNMLKEVTYQAKPFQYGMWADYFKSGQIIEDLDAIIESLIHHKKAGATDVLFGAF
ncbi:hypothetical protein [Hymenobacter pini]|uniref:hypothetical protein n=1 Tax=Hymenobacter pini TaxID=2880879 RepID=UPI001CF56BBD|nr:hypothetical protein [Hymenobacter pini]MCA8831051.1 hypothetical protein [Hymenobacter pini]